MASSMGSFCNNDDSSPLVAAPIVSLTQARICGSGDWNRRDKMPWRHARKQRKLFNAGKLSRDLRARGCRFRAIIELSAWAICAKLDLQAEEAAIFHMVPRRLLLELSPANSHDRCRYAFGCERRTRPCCRARVRRSKVAGRAFIRMTF